MYFLNMVGWPSELGAELQPQIREFKSLPDLKCQGARVVQGNSLQNCKIVGSNPTLDSKTACIINWLDGEADNFEVGGSSPPSPTKIKNKGIVV